MFDSRSLKADAALIASAPRASLGTPFALSAILRLLDLPGPNRWPPLARKLRQCEFEEFRALCRELLDTSSVQGVDVLRLQLYAELVFEALEADHQESNVARSVG